jgi:hypothetical protein
MGRRIIGKGRTNGGSKSEGKVKPCEADSRRACAQVVINARLEYEEELASTFQGA